MSSLPPFSVLTANYPAKSQIPTKQLLDSIGGPVREHLDDDVNTCALRMSACLNASGAPLIHVGGLYTLKGARHTRRIDISRLHLLLDSSCVCTT